MKRLFVITLFLISLMSKTAAQQNWTAVPCSKMKDIDAVNRMFIDSLHNEIILYSTYGYEICNTTYKGIFAYNGSNFHDLDFGINKHKPSLGTQGIPVNGCITFGNKTLFGGAFHSVGSTTLYAKSLALWNGAVWDTFPTHVFDNTPSFSSGGAFAGFLRWNNKLIMYGGFDTIGNTITKNIAAYDGNTFSAVPSIPVNNPATVTKMIVYKNKLIATGNFYDYPSFNMFRLAQFDGSDWAPLGNGVQGGLSACQDMAVYKDTLYIAGSFPKSAGNAGNYIMKWDGTQFYDAGFGDFCGSGTIWSLVPFKNRLYAFGGYACAANQKTFGMSFYENGKWTVSQDSIDNFITSALVYKDAIYIGGGFRSINGDTTIQKFAKLLCPDFDAASGCISGLKESTKRITVKVFPNPSKNNLQLEFEPGDSIDKVIITNPLGQEIFKLLTPSTKQEIDVSQLPAGIYFLKAENSLGQGVFKVVKE